MEYPHISLPCTFPSPCNMSLNLSVSPKPEQLPSLVVAHGHSCICHLCRCASHLVSVRRLHPASHCVCSPLVLLPHPSLEHTSVLLGHWKSQGIPHLLLVQVCLQRLAEAVGRRWQERIMLVTILNKSVELALSRKQQLAFAVLWEALPIMQCK